jgi:S1-C subfamily serine protease
VKLAEAPIAAVPNETRLVSRGASPSGLGIEVADLTGTFARRYGIAESGGVVVTDVAPYGAADRKGIAEGHRILSIDRQPAGSARDVRSLLRRASPGDIVSLLVQSPDGRTSIVNVRIP